LTEEVAAEALARDVAVALPLGGSHPELPDVDGGRCLGGVNALPVLLAWVLRRLRVLWQEVLRGQRLLKVGDSLDALGAILHGRRRQRVDHPLVGHGPPFGLGRANARPFAEAKSPNEQRDSPPNGST